MPMTEFIRSRAPLRIGFAGGGTDVDPYASKKGGAVLNTTIDMYAYCTVVPNNTSNISIKSLDYGEYNLELGQGPLPYDGNMDLVKAVANHFEITEGFDLFVHSDAPPGSGLGGSSTVMVSIIAAVCEWLDKEMTSYEMAELAYVLEREKIGLGGGKQDQYAAVFGGFNFMEFSSSGARVSPLRISSGTKYELEYCSLLCYTGRPRESAGIIGSQVENFRRGSNEAALDASKKLSKDMRDALSRGNIRETAELLDLSWQYKKQFSDKVTNEEIDCLYTAAMEKGAVGGKISGAGGGGFMYFICEYDKKHLVAKEMRKRGATVASFVFEPRGVRTWRYEG
jgi:D-glycero-alpha-D-manno-heptose-7-phosphate kinase